MNCCRLSIIFNLVVFVFLAKQGSCQYTSGGCRVPVTQTSNYFVLDANHGKWPGSGFCQAINSKIVQTNTYQVKAQLLNYNGWNGVNSGHLGLIYNVQNSGNYDFVYFRPHTSSRCFQTGFVVNGVPTFTAAISAACPGQGPPKGRQWFDVRVEVNKNKAKIFLEGKFVREVTPHYPAKGHGGVLVANGYRNIVHFRNFDITQYDNDYLVTSCVAASSGSTGSYFVLDASHGSWPSSGFCSALNEKVTLTGNKYAISAEIFNKIGRGSVNFGHPGLLYNARNKMNYDFVYFRPHSSSGCFQTGFVVNGVPTFTAAISAACPGQGPPKGGQWFDVRVEVNNNKAKIFLEGKFVREVTPHYPAKGHGGVLVGNGYANIVHFRNFDITQYDNGYLVTSCVVASSGSTGSYFVLDANHGKWPGSGFCQAINSKIVQTNTYQVKAQLLNYNGWNGVNSGHLGLIYNVQNSGNYDFVYFRPHTSSRCFQTGFVVNGVPTFTAAISAACPGQGPPKGRQWFDVRVEVNNNKAKIFLEGKFVREVTPHYPAKGHGGVLVANGYRNIVHFRNFDITQYDNDYLVTSCVAASSGSTGSYFVLDASHGSWPSSGFCSALNEKVTLTGNKYAISAEIFNKIGRGSVNFGHPGLLYNARNKMNYDFVYFRPHSSSGCFQTGFVVNGVPTFTAAISAACPGQGPPKGGQWFDVRVEVNNNKAKIFLEGKFVREVTPHYPAKGHGGKFDITQYDNGYLVTSCVVASSGSTGSYFVLDANHGRWPGSGFCQAINSKIVQTNTYQVKAQLLNYNGWNGVNSGHLGLIYNVQNSGNYDFVYFRPHTSSRCFQTGFVVNGVPTFTAAISAACPGQGPPKGGQWFDVRVEVNNNKAKIFLEGKFVREVTPHYPAKGHGGVLVANGYRNIVHFRNFDITQYDDYLVTSCVVASSGSTGSYFVLDASHGSWPSSGFCSALNEKVTLTGNKYAISAEIFNKIGRGSVNFGHPGLLYNARNKMNYDFVYFRPHSSSGCFQTGFVVNGVPTFTAAISAPCPGQGPPKGGQWFDVRVEVNNNKAKIFLEGKFVREVTPHYPAKGHGGVLVGNGYANIVHFRAYRICSG
ncbi:uncharacterized protein LOC114528075 [Dendronephthya gigantea]|uniref:uncharacterized protein LOC114528075 n=1 Tax=Dendronephthya gigantea TaxID=151771 RepID=UPI00106CF130|nr:uncharacterized protein LOC114528075 [Dendronephthya gigantea]